MKDWIDIYMHCIFVVDKDQSAKQCAFFPQGNHQSELIEHRISSIKVTTIKEFLLSQ